MNGEDDPSHCNGHAIGILILLVVFYCLISRVLLKMKKSCFVRRPSKSYFLYRVSQKKTFLKRDGLNL